MMDADDGYILWTAIWKGMSRKFRQYDCGLTRFWDFAIP